MLPRQTTTGGEKVEFCLEGYTVQVLGTSNSALSVFLMYILLEGLDTEFRDSTLYISAVATSSYKLVLPFNYGLLPVCP